MISMILMNGGRLEKDDLDYLNEKLSVDSLDSLIDFLKLVRNIHEGERQAFLKSLVK
ncbi:MAG: hypothetical protein HWD61_13770 [Parachlamydiaceae bacterium]|nr:MAG: hypothetical protein HWD61_13770 [Parachlamydiaceae bacterium]